MSYLCFEKCYINKCNYRCYLRLKEKYVRLTKCLKLLLQPKFKTLKSRLPLRLEAHTHKDTKRVISTYSDAAFINCLLAL